MALLRRYNPVLALTVLLGMLAFSLADGRPLLALLSAVGGLAGWRAGRAGGGDRPWALPRGLINLLVLGAILNAALQAARAGGLQQPIVSVLGEFLVYIQILKLFDRRTVRDDSQVLTLSLFVVIAAILTSNALGVGAILLVYTPLATTAAMLLQIRSGQREADAGAGREAPAPLVEGRRSSRHFARFTLVAVAGAAVVATGIFLVTPRGLGSDTLGRFGMGRQAQVGFNETIQLGRSGFLDNNTPIPVLDLQVTDRHGQSVGSGQRTYYLRGAAREWYRRSTRTWETNFPGGQNDVQINPDTLWRPPGAEGDASAGALEYRFTFRTPSEDSYLFTVWRPTGLTFPSISDSDRAVRFSYSPQNLVFRTRRTSRPGFQYVVQAPVTDSKLSGEAPSGRLGFQTGPVRDLAAGLLGARGIRLDPEQRDAFQNRAAATAIRDHLRNNYQYTLEMFAPAPEQDPIEMFLFSTKRGHCEYFASAMAAMCQSVGLSSRVVAGFVATEYNTLTGSYVVRQSNAHAWVEVHLGDGHWVPFDPSPPADIERIHRPSGGIASTLRRWYDTLEFGWSRGIIGFDVSRQERLFGVRDSGRIAAARRSEGFANRVSAFFQGTFGGVRGLDIPAWVFRYLVPGLIALALVAVAVGRSGIRLRAGSRGCRAAGHDPELVSLLRSAGFYSAALASLERAGIGKPAHRPLGAHAADLSRSRADVARPLAAIAELYYRLRFGRRSLSLEQTETAARRASELDAALRSHPR